MSEIESFDTYLGIGIALITIFSSIFAWIQIQKNKHGNAVKFNVTTEKDIVAISRDLEVLEGAISQLNDAVSKLQQRMAYIEGRIGHK